MSLLISMSSLREFSPLRRSSKEMPESSLSLYRSLATSALAAPIPYIKPTVFEQGQGSLNLEEARHPCLEVQEGINFISNDCNLERDKPIVLSFPSSLY